MKGRVPVLRRAPALGDCRAPESRKTKGVAALVLVFAFVRLLAGGSGRLRFCRSPVVELGPGAVATAVGSRPAAKGEPGTGVSAPVFASTA